MQCSAVVIVVVVVLFLVELFGVECNRASPPPHVLLIVVDDLGWNDVGFHGSDIATPFIDSLAQSGTILNNYYVQPLCSPSRTALMSGRYPYHTGLAHFVILNGFNQSIPINETLLPQKMRENGYKTHMFGKWDCGMTTWGDTPTYRGFDTFYGFYNGFEDYYTKMAFAYPVAAKYQNITGLDFRNNVTADNSTQGQYSTNLYISKTVDTIMGHDTQDPMFLYLALQAIHSPLESPAYYNDMCNSTKNKDRKIVCGMMQAVDEGIKNVTDALKERGFLNNTLIIFTTDNGAHTPDGGNNWPYRGNKATVFEGGMKGSAFMWGSMVPVGQTANNLMHITDWLPTLMAAIGGGANTTQKLDGFNQWPSLVSGKPSPRNQILLQLDPPNNRTGYIGQAALRYNNWKLIVGLANCTITEAKVEACPTGWIPVPPAKPIDAPPDPSDLIFLYDIQNDPYEKNNIAVKQPDIVTMMQQKLQVYKNEGIVQQPMIFDPTSDPKYFGGFWTPWKSHE